MADRADRRRVLRLARSSSQCSSLGLSTTIDGNVTAEQFRRVDLQVHRPK
jgi:hypothetical protein